MKIKAKFKGSCHEGNSLFIELEISHWLFQRVENDLKIDDTYVIDIMEKQKKRTLEQNAMLWELLTQIDEKVNGTRQPWEWYLNAIKQTGAKTKVIYLEDESLDELKEMCMNRDGNIRAVESLGMADDLYAYRIFFGSSKFNTKEMSLLIDTVLDMAQLVGIDRFYWEELLDETK